MSDNQQQPGRVLYIITCATPAARDIGKLVSLAQERGWRVCVIATPSALAFIDKAVLEERTGFPVRHQYKEPGAADALPMADAIIVGGASFNTLNKWALGVSDTLALGLINEGIGLGIPIVALPFLNAAQAHTRPSGETSRYYGRPVLPYCSAPKATNHMCHIKARRTCTSIRGRWR